MTPTPFDPVPALERAGIDDYSIDYDLQVVQLHEEDMKRWLRHIFPAGLWEKPRLILLFRGWRFEVREEEIRR